MDEDNIHNDNQNYYPPSTSTNVPPIPFNPPISNPYGFPADTFGYPLTQEYQNPTSVPRPRLALPPPNLITNNEEFSQFMFGPPQQMEEEMNDDTQPPNPEDRIDLSQRRSHASRSRTHKRRHSGQASTSNSPREPSVQFLPNPPPPPPPAELDENKPRAKCWDYFNRIVNAQG